MISKVASVLILITLFYACRSSARVNIKGSYFLESDDYRKYIVGYQVDERASFLILVDVYVFAAGYSESFIVAIQHPKTRKGIGTDSSYYIIPFHKDYTFSPQDGIIGPLTFNDYNKKKSTGNSKC